MKKKIIIILFSILMFFILMPASALAADENRDGYEDNDYTKIQAFLNQISDDGIKTNGLRMNAMYDPNNPHTWTGVEWTHHHFPKRVTNTHWANKGLSGELDLSEFASLTSLDCGNNDISAINLNDCASLTNIDVHNNRLSSLEIDSNASYIDCADNLITSLDVSSKSALQTLACENNNITNLNINGCNNLMYLNCSNNDLTGTFDVSSFNKLYRLICNDNSIASLKLASDYWYFDLRTDNNKIKSITTGMFSPGQSFTANGDGYISLNMNMFSQEIALNAKHNGNFLFYNWTQDSTEISKSPVHYLNPFTEKSNLTANFKPGLSADPSDGVIYTGGRVTVTPLFTGGVWQYDNAFLQGNLENADKPVFKGLKSGVTQVRYTIDPKYTYETPPVFDIPRSTESTSGWQENPDINSVELPDRATLMALQVEDEQQNDTVTVALDINIKKSLLPLTGQNFTLAIILALIGIITAATTFIVIRRKNKKA